MSKGKAWDHPVLNSCWSAHSSGEEEFRRAKADGLGSNSCESLARWPWASWGRNQRKDGIACCCLGPLRSAKSGWKEEPAAEGEKEVEPDSEILSKNAALRVSRGF